MTAKSTFFAIAALLACTFAVASSSRAAESVELQSIKKLSATVESIGDDDRVWLRGEDGRSWSIVIPSDLRKSEKINVGDKLLVRYRESIVASVKPKGSRANGDDGKSNSASKGKGYLAGSSTSRTAIIKSVDKSRHSISYKDADGLSRDAIITNPDAQAFIETLKPGDEVEVTYTDAMAVGVEHEK